MPEKNGRVTFGALPIELWTLRPNRTRTCNIPLSRRSNPILTSGVSLLNEFLLSISDFTVRSFERAFG